jgi:hypothetical protein
MNYYRQVIVSFAIVGVLCPFVSPVLAQEAKPKPPKAAKEKPGAKPAEMEVLAPEDPAVAAIMATRPTTPAECVRAAKTLSDLGHADVAKPLLKKVLDAKLDAQQLADLGEQFGSPTFIDLAGKAALLPEAKQLSDAVVAAVTARLDDAKRIAGLTEQLQDPVGEKRVQALAGLQSAGRAAIGPLLSVLADPGHSAEYANVRTVLAGLGRDARRALVAVIETADPKLKVQAILTLAEMKDSKAAINLVEPCVSEKGDAEVRTAATEALRQLTGRVPTRPEAIGMLANAAKIYMDRRQPIEGVSQGRVELWRWDADKRQCVVQRGTPDDAARLLAARFARDAYALDPANGEIRLLCITTMLDVAAYTNGLDRPLDEKSPAVVEAKQFGVKTLGEALDYAMAHGHPAAATVAARLLGEMGKAEEVLHQGDKPAPLVLAVQSPDRRLRMAALAAIVRLQPVKPYPGSSYVLPALGFFAASSGVRHALVAGPSIEQARELAGMLAAAGLQTTTAGTGRETLLLATRSPDYEMAWIEVSIDHPPVATLLQELRRDPRTASLRIGLVAREGYLELAERLAASDPMSKAFSRPHDEKACRWQLDQLAAIAPQEFVSFPERQKQAAEALDLLAELSRSSQKLYDLRQVQDSVLTALYNPKLAVKAVAVLVNWNSAESQRTLVDVASRFSHPLELRQAAATAFCKNREKYGILLTAEQIQQQYRRYNESKDQDAATQHVLGLILDCLEAGAGTKR